MKGIKLNMSNVLVFKRSMLKLHCVWDKNWISEYESTWSLIEKFRYINSISCLDFAKYFGINQLNRGNTDIYQLNNFDNEKLNREFRFNIIKYNLDNLFEISKEAFDKKNFKSFLWICPICIQKGYHSIFNQYKFIHNCPFHNIPLVASCPNCHHKRKYILETREETAPFQCNCGFNFLNRNLDLTSWVVVKRNSIKIKSLLKWLNCNNLKITNFIFSNFDYSHKGKIDSELYFKHNIAEVMKFNNYLPETDNEENLRLCCKGKGNHLTNQQLHDKRIQFLGISKYVKFFNQNYTEMLKTSRETVDDYLENIAKTLFTSIARRIRRTLLKQHKSCIHYIFNNFHNLSPKKVCSIAYAYLLWIKKSQKLHSIEEIKSCNPIGMYRPHHGLFPIINNYNFVLDGIINDWHSNQSFINKPPHSFEWENLGWITSKVLELIYLSDFNKCIRVINESISNGYPIEERILNLEEQILQPSIIIPSFSETYDYLQICYKGKHYKISSYKEFKCPNKN